MTAAVCAASVIPAARAATVLARTSVAPGSSLHGTLPAGDSSATYVGYTLGPGVQGPVTIDLRSLDFDAALAVSIAGAKGEFSEVASNDDGGVGTDSRLVLKADSNVVYRIEARATEDDWGGSYELAVSGGRTPALDAAAKQAADEAYYRAVQEHSAATGNNKRLRRIHGWWAVTLSEAKQYDEALKALDKARALTAATDGADSTDALNDLMNRAIILRHRGSQEEAKRTLEEARSLAEKILAGDRRNHVKFLGTYSENMRELGDDAAAKAALEHALDIAQGPGAGNANRVVPHLWSDLAEVNEHLEDVKEAERAYLASAAASEKVFGPHDDATGVAQFALCLFYERNDRLADAEKAGLAALKIHEGAAGDSGALVAYDLNALGEIYVLQGRNQEAEKTLKRAISVGDEKMAHTEVWKNQSILVTALSALGNLYNDLGRYREAQPLLERAVTLTKTSARPERQYWDDLSKRNDDRLQIASLENLANIYFWQSKYSQAEPLARKVLERREQSLPADHPEVARSLGNLGRVLTALGRPAEAAPLLERALKIQEDRYGSDAPLVATLLQRLAVAYGGLHRDKDAVAALERALAIRDKKQPGTMMHATVLNDLALRYRPQGKLQDARSMLDRSLEIDIKEVGPEHPETATTMVNLGCLEVDLENFARGEELELRALKIRTKVFGAPSPEVANSDDNLGWLYRKQKRYDKAERYFREAVAMYEATLGPDHPDTVRVRKSLAGSLRESGKSEGADAPAATGTTSSAR